MARRARTPNTPLSAEERTLRARVGAHALHTRVEDPKAHTAPATRAAMSRFEQQVDPDGKLPPADRARRAEHARKAYFTQLAYRSARVRSAAAQARKAQGR